MKKTASISAKQVFFTARLVPTKVILALVMTLATLAISAKTKVIERPWFEGANTRTIKIMRVELTRRATVLDIRASYQPQGEIRISSGAVLEADGRRFALAGAEGIVPDSVFIIPETGEADFRLVFEPLPKGARSFDFVEGEGDGAWCICGVALDGEEHDSGFPEGLPDEFRREPIDGALPEPLFTGGKTTVRVHLLGNKRLRRGEFTLTINNLDNNQAEIPLRFDSDGVAVAEFRQFGTSYSFIDGSNGIFGYLWIAPGDDMDVYLDSRVFGYAARRTIVHYRPGGWNIEVDKSCKPNPHGYVYTTGRYAELNRFYSLQDFSDIPSFDNNKLSHRMTGDEYTAEIVRQYRDIAVAIAAKPWPQMIREYALSTMQQATMGGLCQPERLLSRFDEEAQTYTELPYDSLRTRVEERHLRQLAEQFDVDSPALLMGSQIGQLLYPSILGQNWSDATAATSPRVRLAKAIDLRENYAEKGRLDQYPDDYRALVGSEHAGELEAIDADAKKRTADVAGLVLPTPDVPLDSLFAAIIAPHRGKVVVVDFWNTWCAPCRAAIKENEPLKDGELNSPDIVWIYLSDESSPATDYARMVPDIRGLHYRPTTDQWRHIIKNDFPEIDGIPAYALVKRDGTCQLRLDFRNHETMKSEVKKALAE